MSTINVKRSVQFHPELYSKSDHSDWLDAVGKELEAKGVSIKVGEGANARVVKNATDLKAAFAELKKSSSTAAAKAYLTDLAQALDDVVKGDAKLATGDAFDFTKGSALSKALGVDDSKRSNYASLSTTDFGRASKTKPEATMTVDGVTLQVKDPPIVIGPDLSKIPHMSVESLKGAPVAYGRDGEEVEDTRVITGLSKDEVVALANNSLDDLQRSRAAVGLTVGSVPLDEMAWDSESHALRRANPYVSFSLDSRSVEMNPRSGQQRVGVGRDFFFDTFMAKKDVNTGKLTKDLQKADLMYRTRIRYGTDTDPFKGTRVLIGMKEGTAIDAQGTKHARKIDNRTDSPNQAVFDTLTATAQTGKIDRSWGWSADSVAPAASAMYRTALQKGITDNISGETGVLALEPGAMARQIRGRFHLDETDQSSIVRAFADAGEPKIKELAGLIAQAPDWAASGNSPSKADLLKQANALLDRSAIVAAATEGIQKIKPGVTVNKALIDSLWPGQQITTKEQAKMQRAVVDAIRTSYDAFSQNIDDLQRNIGGTTDRAVRDAGNATDVRDYFRQKAALSRFKTYAEGTGVQKGDVPGYLAAAKKIADMPDGKPKNELLQSIGVGLNLLTGFTEESYKSPVVVDGQLGKKQTFDGYIAALDAQSTGPNKDAFIAELGAYLASKNSPALQTSADKAKVLADLKKNLVTAHTEVLHRFVEGAAAWGQASWFNNYRETMLNINPQGWNFIIGSMDYTEFYDTKGGNALTFQERVSRKPLDPSKMVGAMISNDIQIELEAEEGYTAAIRRAQYGVNAAGAGLAMDYALSKNVPGLTKGDAAAFEKWFAAQAALPAAQQKAFVDDLAAYAKSKGSPLDIAQLMGPLGDQEKSIRVLSGFAVKKNPALASGDRKAIEDWYRQQAQLPEDKLNDFLTEVAQYGADQKSEIPLSPNLLRTLDFQPFAGANVGRDVAGHAGLVEDLSVSNEVWSMVKQAQRDLSNARGQEVQRVLKDNNLKNKKWEPPTKAKGDYAIDYAMP